jgi:hypothetical protein
MNNKQYNAQRQGNEDHLHIQDEQNKPVYKKTVAKEKQEKSTSKKKVQKLAKA